MSKYDRILAEAKEEARKEIEQKENKQEVRQDIKQEIKPAPNSAPKPTPMKNPFPTNKLFCKYCGKELSPQGLFQHEKHCPENPINIAKREMDAEKEMEQKELAQQDWERQAEALVNEIKKGCSEAGKEVFPKLLKKLQELKEKELGREIDKEVDDSNTNAPRPTIPLSYCSRDINYVKENKPFYMKVMGRKIGDKVYVEEVELMRL